MAKSDLFPFLAILLANPLAQAAAPPPPKGDPLKGVVVGRDVVNCVLVERSVIDAYVHPLDKDRPTRGRWCAVNTGSFLRWQIGQGAFWVCHDFNAGPPFRSRDIGGGYLVRIDLGVFVTKGENLFNRTDAQFQCRTPADWFTFHAFDPRYFFYSDYLPASKAQARQFVATNLTSPFKERNREFERGKTPASVFSCYLGESRFDPKEGLWKPLPGKLEWSAPVAFKEPFQALGLGDDYYFVTRSGSLYRAAKPAKGTGRTLERVWDGKGRPIRAFIGDAKTGKTFLFVPPEKAGDRPAFFELSPTPRPEEYDPKLVPPPKLEEPHRTVVHAARILVALKKIEGKLPAEAGGK